ncbi:MAG: hypothetical protein RL518_607 [Pseudomonadota bacterium]|jgi:hypothetical protein
MKQGTKETPRTNPGDSTPHYSFSFSDVLCISGDFFRQHVLREEASQGQAAPDSPYKEWIESLPQHLSKTSQQIIKSWWAFGLLSDVYNCGAAHTKLFGPDVDHTRADHSIHAAYVARNLTERVDLKLSEHEKTVLELVMLLHDPHRLGSHALDNVIASIPGAPKIEAWGWGEDFHEYHGAQQIYKDRALREILGVYWADVLAVLSYPDNRPHDDPGRISDFGPTPPTLLSKEKINLMCRLKDEIDKMSYLDLDFRCSGFEPALIASLQQCIQDYQQLFVTVNGNLAVIVPQRKDGSARNPHDAYPFDPWIGARQLHRENIATHPTACLVDAVLREALADTVQSNFKGQVLSEGCYRFVRNVALEGNYQKLFGTSVLKLLTAPRSAQETLGLEDLYAPLVTLTIDDLTEVAGRNSLNSKVSPAMSAELGCFPRTDMTLLEYQLRQHLRSKGLEHRLFVILSNDFEKILKFKVVEGAEQQCLDNSAHDAKKHPTEVLDVVRFAVRTSASSQKLVIGIKALDDSGNCKELGSIQSEIRAFLRGHKFLKDPKVLETNYNPRAFCEPLVEHLFRPDVRKRMAEFKPAWVIRGGCGLTNP